MNLQAQAIWREVRDAFPEIAAVRQRSALVLEVCWWSARRHGFSCAVQVVVSREFAAESLAQGRSARMRRAAVKYIREQLQLAHQMCASNQTIWLHDGRFADCERRAAPTDFTGGHEAADAESEPGELVACDEGAGA